MFIKILGFFTLFLASFITCVEVNAANFKEDSEDSMQIEENMSQYSHSQNASQHGTYSQEENVSQCSHSQNASQRGTYSQFVFETPSSLKQSSQPAVMDELDTAELDKVFGLLLKCEEQLNNMDNSTQSIHTTDIKAEFDQLKYLFAPKDGSNPNPHFTTITKKNLGEHIECIGKLSPGSFQKQGPEDFHIDRALFVDFESPDGNKVFVPQKALTTEFLLFTCPKDTSQRPNYQRLFEGLNPQSNSGSTNYHHVFQNQETITLISSSTHRKESYTLHRASQLPTQINRTDFSGERSNINRKVGVLGIANICANFLDDNCYQATHPEAAYAINRIRDLFLSDNSTPSTALTDRTNIYDQTPKLVKNLFP